MDESQPQEVILDENELAKKSDYFDLGGIEVGQGCHCCQPGMQAWLAVRASPVGPRLNVDVNQIRSLAHAAPFLACFHCIAVTLGAA
jgi:hypothetical protein